MNSAIFIPQAQSSRIFTVLIATMALLPCLVAAPQNESLTADELFSDVQVASSDLYSTNGLPSHNAVWLSVDAVFGKVKTSNALVGSPNAPQAFRDFYAASGSAVRGAHVGTEFLQPGLVGQSVHDDYMPGIRGKMGVRMDSDGSLELSGLWLDDGVQSWSRGLGGLNAGADPNTVRVTAGLPLDDGAGGYAVPFDQYFSISFKSNVKGCGGDFAPFGIWSGAILVQPTIGMRYYSIAEQFAFAGADSGLNYTYSQTGLPDPATLNPPVVAFPPYQSSLNSRTSTSLVGPMLGFNVATTRKTIRFNSQSRVGWMYASSSTSLNGQGLGNGFALGFDPLVTFSDQRKNSYDTPCFEQSLGADIDLSSTMLRGYRRSTPETLVLRLGWMITVIPDVARPLDSVVWNGFPLTPQLNDNTVTWQLQTLSAGLVYQY